MCLSKENFVTMVMANTVVVVTYTQYKLEVVMMFILQVPCNVICLALYISLCCKELINFILGCDKKINVFVLHITQLLAQMVNCGWWVVGFPMKAGWRSVSTVSGVLCVMTTGTVMMPLWCVDS